MSAKHTHSKATSSTRGYTATARGARHEEPRAHGGVCVVEMCTCGYQRERNTNGRFEEEGAWYVSPALARQQDEAAAVARAKKRGFASVIGEAQPGWHRSTVDLALPDGRIERAVNANELRTVAMQQAVGTPLRKVYETIAREAGWALEAGAA